eukprot:3934094-Rhodomonas_salina.16
MTGRGPFLRLRDLLPCGGPQIKDPSVAEVCEINAAWPCERCGDSPEEYHGVRRQHSRCGSFSGRWVPFRTAPRVGEEEDLADSESVIMLRLVPAPILQRPDDVCRETILARTA